MVCNLFLELLKYQGMGRWRNGWFWQRVPGVIWGTTDQLTWWLLCSAMSRSHCKGENGKMHVRIYLGSSIKLLLKAQETSEAYWGINKKVQGVLKCIFKIHRAKKAITKDVSWAYKLLIWMSKHLKDTKEEAGMQLSHWKEITNTILWDFVPASVLLSSVLNNLEKVMSSGEQRLLIPLQVSRGLKLKADNAGLQKSTVTKNNLWLNGRWNSTSGTAVVHIIKLVRTIWEWCVTWRCQLTTP